MDKESKGYGEKTVALAIFLGSAFVFWTTIGDTAHSQILIHDVGSLFYPRILLGLTALLAAVVLLSRQTRDTLAETVECPAQVSLLIFATIAYAALIRIIGFVVASSSLIVFSAFITGYRRYSTVGIVAVAYSWGVATGSHYALQILLPTGDWLPFQR